MENISPKKGEKRRRKGETVGRKRGESKGNKVEKRG